MPNGPKHNGFTLLELMVSLALMVLIVGIVFGSLRIGSRAWERGERDVESHQKTRIVLGMIQRQLASTCVHEVKGPGGKSFLLKGDDKSLTLVSYIPLIPTNKYGMVYAYYQVEPKQESEGERLVFYEKNVVLLNEDSDLDSPNEDDFTELISGINEIGFEYLKDQDDEDSDVWQQKWDPEDDEGFPKAIKVVLKVDEEKNYITVIARIASEKET